MSFQTYINAIEKIKSDTLSFLFCSMADKRERQLLKFQRAAQQSEQPTCATCGSSTWANAVEVGGKKVCTKCGASG